MCFALDENHITSFDCLQQFSHPASNMAFTSEHAPHTRMVRVRVRVSVRLMNSHHGNGDRTFRQALLQIHVCFEAALQQKLSLRAGDDWQHPRHPSTALWP